MRRLAGDAELARTIGAGGLAAYREQASEAVLGARWLGLVERLVDAVTPAVVVWAAAAAFAGGFGATAVLRHRAFESGRFDLGNMTQAVWSTAHGDVLSVTDVHGEQISRLGSHFDPILALLAPLWWLWPDPELLLVVQAVAVAAGALPVFWLARKHLGVGLAAAALALAYLLSPPVQWLTVSDFHPVALACPLLLFAWWHLDEGRLWAFALLAAAAIATKEHVGLAVAAIGVWYAVRHRAPRAGAAIAVTAGAAALVAALVDRPPLRARRHLGVREPLRVAVARRSRPLLPRLAPAPARRCSRSPGRSRCSPRCRSSG